MKLLKQVQGLPHPLNDGVQITHKDLPSSTLEGSLLDNTEENIISYWLCRFAFSSKYSSEDKLQWFLDQEIRLFAHYKANDSNYQYENEFKQDFYQGFDEQDAEKYMQLGYTSYISNPKYVLSLLSHPMTYSYYAIKNGKILITDELYSKFFKLNMSILFESINFLDYFNETQEFAKTFASEVNPDIEDLFQQILDLQYQDCVINDTQLTQQYASEVRAATLPGLIVSGAVPLCMSKVIFQLQSKHHLKHMERMQLYPWLQDIGVPLQDSIEFIKRYFCQDGSMSGDKFKKEYQYNIEHIYGQQGKKQKSHCLGCQSIIKTIPGPGQSYGCPYRTLNQQDLEDLLSKNGFVYDNIKKYDKGGRVINFNEIRNQVFQAKNKNNFTNACEKVFYAINGNGLGIGINPVRYTAETMAQRNQNIENQQNETNKNDQQDVIQEQENI